MIWPDWAAINATACRDRLGNQNSALGRSRVRQRTDPQPSCILRESSECLAVPLMDRSVSSASEVVALGGLEQACRPDVASRGHDERRLWTRRAALAAPLFLAACASEVVEAPPPDRRALEAARADPVRASAWLNAYRAEAGLAAVRLDAQLTSLAQAQADAMAATDHMSHDVAGAFSTRLAAAGVRAGEAGENICAGYYSTDEAMAAWRASPEHDANLRLAAAARFGIALAKNPRSRWGAFWAMAIASPPPTG
jgi:uncharacterized protein YkwD